MSSYSAGSHAQTYEKSLSLSIFRRLGSFPQVHGQVKEWLMHKMISVSNLVAFAAVFILFYQWSWQGGGLKVIDNDLFLVFLAIWGLIPKFLERLR